MALISSVLCQLDAWVDAACGGCKFAWDELFRFPTIYSFHISKFQLNQQGSIMYFACFPISHTIRAYGQAGDILWGKGGTVKTGDQRLARSSTEWRRLSFSHVKLLFR